MAEHGGFIDFIRKNALKTTENSGFRAKYRHFPYIKQNSIAEIVSTMESFWVAEMGFESRMGYLLFCGRIRKMTQYAAVATADIDPGGTRSRRLECSGHRA